MLIVKFVFKSRLGTIQGPWSLWAQFRDIVPASSKHDQPIFLPTLFCLIQREMNGFLKKRGIWKSDGKSLNSDALIYYLCDLSQSLNFSKTYLLHI